MIAPTGIATDATTADFFGTLVKNKQLRSLIDFENREGLFAEIDSRMRFCMLTIARSHQPNFAFFLAHPSQLLEPQRRFSLSPDAISKINPNTGTAPIFRSQYDAELTAKIYSKVPVLIDESVDGCANPWSFSYMTKMFDMADNSGEFRSLEQLTPGKLSLDCNGLHLRSGKTWVPLYEAKMVNIYDHRWATYEFADFQDVDVRLKQDSEFEVKPRYWLPAERVAERLRTKNWKHKWMMGWRDITNATNERTVIAALYPAYAVGHTLRNAFVDAEPDLAVAFLASLCSLVVDYSSRQKIGGTHLTVEILKQLPILPPTGYPKSQLPLIRSRVLELCYTSRSLAPLASTLGYEGPAFSWHPERRAKLQSELDAWYAHAYGLTRDELRYILDPADVMGEDYPSETFRVLKKNELKKYGEYRTGRLVLEAWDRLEAGDLK